MNPVKVTCAAIFTLFATFAAVITAPSAQAWTDPEIAISVLQGTGYGSGSGVAIDSNGNILTTGLFTGTVDFNPGAGTATLSAVGEDIYISKLDPDGNFLWAKSISGPSDESIESIELDANDNIYMTGFFGGTVDFDPGVGVTNLVSRGYSDAFFLKLDSSGGYLWAKSVGASYSDTYGYDIAVDSSGNVYAVGTFQDTVNFNPSGRAVNLSPGSGESTFVLKFDSSGNYVLARKYSGNSFAVATSIALDLEGNFLITGFFGGTADFDPGDGIANLNCSGMSDNFIAKYNGFGNYIWAKRIGGSGNDSSEISTSIDASGHVFISGTFFGANFSPGEGATTLNSAGSGDIFISEYDSTGTYLWAKRIGGTGFDYASSAGLDGNKNILITGFFSGTVDFNPGAGTANLVSAGNYEIFIAKYDPTGDHFWSRQLGGAGDDESVQLAVDAGGNAFITGYFMDTADFDPGSGIANIVSAGAEDAFIFRITSSGEASSASLISSSSSSSSSSATTDPVAAAAAQREAAQKAARAELLVRLANAKPATAGKFAEAGINGVTDSNIAAVNEEIALLPADSRTSLSSIIKIARKFEVVGMISTSQVRQVLPTLYVEVGLIPADSKNKTSLVNAVKRLSAEDRNSFEAIKIAIAAEQAAITRRSEHLELVRSRNSSR